MSLSIPFSFDCIALIGKYQTTGSRDALIRLGDFLSSQGRSIILETQTALHTGITQWPHMPIDQLKGHAQLALVMGGDGTMLGAGVHLAQQDIPVIGIHQGRLGFMTDLTLDRYEESLLPMLQGQFIEESRAMMEASIWRNHQCIKQTQVLNDVVIRGNTGGLIEMRVQVHPHFVAQHRADGLIIATPTGSTAYALSAGGPIVHPDIAGWVMAPIAPHTLTYRPIVLPNNKDISIEFLSDSQGAVHFDMHLFSDLQTHDQLQVRASQHHLRLLHPIGWSYFDTLRRKLRWNEDTVLG